MSKPCLEHSKVYAPITVGEYPAFTPWICFDCGQKGLDKGRLQPFATYLEVVRKFEQKGARV